MCNGQHREPKKALRSSPTTACVLRSKPSDLIHLPADVWWVFGVKLQQHPTTLNTQHQNQNNNNNNNHHIQRNHNYIHSNGICNVNYPGKRPQTV